MDFLRKVRIGPRLRLGYGLLLLLMAALGALTLLRVHRIRQEMRGLSQGELRTSVAANELIRVSNDNAQAKMELFLARSPAAVSQLTERMKGNRQKINAIYARLDSLLTDPDQRALLERAKVARERYKTSTDSVSAFMTAGNTPEAMRVMTERMLPDLRAYLPVVDTLVDAQAAGIHRRLARAEQEYSTARSVTVALILLALVLAGLVTVLLTRSITLPLRRLRALGERLADGDTELYVVDDGRDEVTELAWLFELMACTQFETAAAAAKLGNGDISVQVPLRGERDAIGLTLAAMQKSLQQMVDEAGSMVTAARKGDLSCHVEAHHYEGAFLDLVVGLNEMLEAVAAPIGAASTVLASVADRDLTARVHGEYSGAYAGIKESVNTAAEQLARALGEVRDVSEEVARASELMESGSQGLAEGAAEQAASLEEVASSLQELSSTTRQNAGDAVEARGLAEAARTTVEHGRESIARLSSVMTEIKDSSAATRRIVKTIDEIAFQTNLLALNAAVEAARAGDAGKGFSVVAEEVRALAHRSADAARSTADLIDEALRNVESGVSTNQQVLVQLEEVSGSIQRLSEVMAGLAAASDQQSQGVGEITSAVEQMNGLTQQVAGGAHDSAAASEQLASQAARLRSIVAGFALDLAAEREEAPAQPVKRQGKATRARRRAATGATGAA